MRSRIIFIAEGALIMGAFFAFRAWLGPDEEAAGLAWPELPRWDDARSGEGPGESTEETDLEDPSRARGEISISMSEETTSRGAGEVTVAWDRAALEERLGGGLLEDGVTAVWRAGDELRFACRSAADQVVLDGGLRSPLRRVAGRADEAADLWVLAVHVEGIERATLSWALVPVSDARVARDAEARGVWRGPRAPAAPRPGETLAGTIERRTTVSLFLREEKTIAIYRPPAPPTETPPASDPSVPERGDPFREPAVFYITGGPPFDQLVSILDPLFAAGDLPPVLIVDCGLEPETDQADREESLAAFEGFLYEEVIRWAEDAAVAIRRPEKRFLLGAARGAGLALALALRDAGRPGGGRFGGAVAFSVAASRPLAPHAPDMSFYLLAGTLAPACRDLTRSWASRLEQSGARVACRERVAGNDPVVWCEETAAALRWMQP